jgi:hypothetical protein
MPTVYAQILRLSPMPLRPSVSAVRFARCLLPAMGCVLAVSVHAQAMPAKAPAAVPAASTTTAPASAPWRAPAPARMQFTVQGKYKGLPYQTKAQLDWLPNGQRYEAAQEVQIPILGSRRQASVGAIGPQGLQPEIFIDRGRRESSTTFDRNNQQITFSRGATPAPWVSGTQDRMSVFFQLSGLIAAAPKKYPVGTVITLQAASTSRVAPWSFTVRGTEALQLPAGRMTALKLEHHSDSTDDEDVQSSLWLAPSLQYLPVRIRLVEDGGRDELDLTLQSHSRP